MTDEILTPPVEPAVEPVKVSKPKKKSPPLPPKGSAARKALVLQGKIKE